MPRGWQPYQLPDVQDHSLRTEMQRQAQALYAYGEYVIAVLLWHEPDFDAGLVGRCPRCYVGQGKIADAFGQGDNSSCPVCFGTSFGPGYRARLVRPVLWVDTDDSRIRDQSRHGSFVSDADATVQTTGDFSIRAGDFLIRADNNRYQIGAVNIEPLSTGFAPKPSGTERLGMSLANVVLENKSSTAYIIPPSDPDEVAALLSVQYPRRPLDYSGVDDINGPLVVGK